MIKVRINGHVVHLPTIKGADGKSAYQYAVEAGFEGTEQEFINLLIEGTDVINSHLSDPNAHPDIRKLIAQISNSLEQHVNESYKAKNFIKLIDELNGFEYILKMRGGRIITYCKLVSIEVTGLPTKTVYIEGEEFDPTGIVLTATYEDSSTKQITSGFTVAGPEKVNYGDKMLEFSVAYTAYGVTCTTTSNVIIDRVTTLTELSLIDFEYVDNGDGTFTIIDWKDTLNGEPSTECVIPDDPNIIL